MQSPVERSYPACRLGKQLAFTATCLALALGGCAKGTAARDLSVWIMRPGNISAASSFFAAESARFEHAHPGVHVEVQFIPWLSAHDKLVTSLAGDIPPDISELGSTWTPEFAAVGALAQVDDITQALGGGAAFVAALAASARLPDGHAYGIPWYAGARALLYRKSRFARAHLAPPRTLAELRTAAQRLTDHARGRYGFALMGNNAPLFYPLVWENGGDFARSRNGHWRSTLAHGRAAVQALSYLDDLYRSGVAPRGAIAWSDLDGRTAFGQGTVAMTITGSWSLPSIYAAHPELEGDVGIIPYPSGRPGGPSLSFVGGSHLAIFKHCAQPALARAFILQLLDDRAQRAWASTVGFFPAKAALVRSTIAGGTTPHQSRTFADALLAGRTTPAAPGWGAIEGALTIPTMVQAVLTGQATPERAVARAAAEMNDLLESER